MRIRIIEFAMQTPANSSKADGAADPERPFSAGDAKRLRSALRSLGARRVAEATGIPESTLARLGAEMEVRRSTAIVARQAIAKLDDRAADETVLQRAAR